MTIRDWITGRSTGVPAALTNRVLDLLGSDAAQDAANAADVCLGAAARSLDALLQSGRFGRDTALELLAIDALTTFAFEHASESAAGAEALGSLAARGAHSMAKLALQHG